MKSRFIYPVLFSFSVGMLSFQGCKEKEERKKISLLWEQEFQHIDGFGAGEADWSDELYLFKNRDSVMASMFGDEGLRLNILRGEIFPHYEQTKGNRNFEVDADLNLTTTMKNIDPKSNQMLRAGQLWVTQEAKNKYHVDKLIFSAWSSPTWMKDNYQTKDGNKKQEHNYASGGKLLKENYQNFADYLADFYKAYASAGVAPYAISPSNEPGFAAEWNSCVWTASEMGDFLHNYLGPTFKKEGIPASIIFGENPAWSVVFEKLNMISSLDFVTKILTEYPDLTQFPIIAAGHGYVIPDTLSVIPAEYLKTPIVPFPIVEEKKIPLWVTEISDITPLDISMEDGLYWGKTFHKYLTDANVNAIVWWCGARPTINNESLIIMDKEQSAFIRAKRYDVFGNFSRYIKEGDIRIAVENELPELLVSAYKGKDAFSVVIVNPDSISRNMDLDLRGVALQAGLSGYLTNDSGRWIEQSYRSDKASVYKIDIPASSVLTVTGKIKK
ncbi:MAG: glycoside hydrolase [Bacteroidales bacterium]